MRLERLRKCVKANTGLWRLLGVRSHCGLQSENRRQNLPFGLIRNDFVVFPILHPPHGNTHFGSYFRLRKVGLDALQQEPVACRFSVDGDELSGAKSLPEMGKFNQYRPVCNTQQLTHL